jgi:hypothetical protein
MKSNKCAQCGLVNFESAQSCKRCNASLDETSTAHAAPAGGQGFSAHASAGGYASSSFGGPDDAGLYYKPSGDVTMVGMFGGLAGGLLVGAVLAFVYTYIIFYVPFIYLNFLCTLGLSAGLGLAVGAIMRWGKVRNPALGAAFASLVALAALYVSWAVWLSVLLTTDEEKLSALSVLQHPLGMWEMIVRLNEVGAWKMYNSAVTGLALWVVWLIEALVILIGVPLMAAGTLSADPFCESCQSWCTMDKGLLLINDAEASELKRRTEAKDFDYFKSVGSKRHDAVKWYRLDLHQCPQCGTTSTLTLHHEQLNVDAKGNANVKSSAVMNMLLLSAGDVNNLRRVSQEVTQFEAQPQYA